MERREVLSPFPFTGTFSGSYTVSASPGGIGPGQEASGTISVTITATSTQSLGEDLYQAYITGSVSVTGFLGQSATYPYSGDYNDQENGIETGYDSTGPEPTVQIDIQAYYPGNPLNFISIEGYCTNNSIVAGVNIGINDYDTPNQASVTLGGAPSSQTPTPNPVELTGASFVKEKKGANQIAVDFNGPLDGGSGLPLSDFQLMTVAKGRKRAKVIPLARAAYDPTTDRVTLTPRRKLNVKTPLRLTINGLPGGPSSLVIN